MRHVSLHTWLLALAAVVCLPAAPALGQRVTGPYEGLFGAGPIRDDAPQSLVVRGALFGGWDDSQVKEGFSTAGNEDFLATGTGPGVQGGLGPASRRHGQFFRRWEQRGQVVSQVG